MKGMRINNVGSEIRSAGTRVNLAVSSAAVAFTEDDLPKSYRYVMLQVQTNPVRIGYGSQTPTAADGQRKVSGDEAMLPRETVLQMKFIRESSDATVWALPFNVT